MGVNKKEGGMTGGAMRTMSEKRRTRKRTVRKQRTKHKRKESAV